ncbi:MAG: hypothetical protein IK125_09165 [Lachnospiraceae bacterium]|nr:hypothetical protein [Lachnospiraceae bacterium]
MPRITDPQDRNENIVEIPKIEEDAASGENIAAEIDTEAIVEQAESEIRQEAASSIPEPPTISKKLVIGLAVFGVLLVGAMLYLVAVMFGPSREHIDPEDYFKTAQGIPVILDTALAEQRGMRSADSIYIPITLFTETDSHYYHDTSVNKILYATETEVKSYPIVEAKKTGAGTLSVQGSDGKCFVSLDGAVYADIEIVKEWSPIDIDVLEGPERIWIRTDAQKNYKKATVKKSAALRDEANNKGSILEDMTTGESVYVLGEQGTFSHVFTERGYTGYVKSNALEVADQSVALTEKTVSAYSGNRLSEPVCLVWHQIFEGSAKNQTERFINAIEQTPGVNVVSPTWFSLATEDGVITSFGDPTYVEAAHERGIKVWGLVDNFNKAVDNLKLLSDRTARSTLIASLMSEAQRTGMDGINIDFESNSTGLGGLSKACGIHFIQFVRELSIECRKKGLTLSVDNYVPMSYNEFYHRDRQAECVDYVIIMGYDEHYGGSDPGSTASISFVTTGIENTLKQVPAEKVINAVPFYTRLWKMTPKAQAAENAKIIEDPSSPIGAYALSSSALGAPAVQTILEENSLASKVKWLEAEKQNYVEYESEGFYYKLWIEDEKSMEPRLSFMKSKQLAGVACWKLGLQNESLWNVIREAYGR